MKTGLTIGHSGRLWHCVFLWNGLWAALHATSLVMLCRYYVWLGCRGRRSTGMTVSNSAWTSATSLAKQVVIAQEAKWNMFSRHVRICRISCHTLRCHCYMVGQIPLWGTCLTHIWSWYPLSPDVGILSSRHSLTKYYHVAMNLSYNTSLLYHRSLVLLWWNIESDKPVQYEIFYSTEIEWVH